MDIHDRHGLYRTAKDRLASCDPSARQLNLLHAAAVLLLTLILSIADDLLENAIASTGGLGGMANRSILTTVQSCLRLLPIIVLPFWQMGYTYVTMGLARGNALEKRDLTMGLRRFGPVLRLQLLQTIVYLIPAFLSTQIGTYLFMLTPWAKPMMQAFTEMMYSDSAVLSDASLLAMEDGMVPLMIFWAAVFLLLAAPLYYRFRVADYVLLDNQPCKARTAMRTSSRMMRGNRLTLLKLDLHFWWFYVLDLLVSAVGYVDVLLLGLGVILPFDTMTAYYLTFAIYAVCQIFLYHWRRNEVSAAYVLFYDALRQENAPQPTTPKQPWSY